MYDLQVFFFLFSMLLLPSCWSLEAQIVTYDRSVACAFDIYSNVGKIPLFFPLRLQKFLCFLTVLWILHLGLSSHCELFSVYEVRASIFQLFGPICWKDGFSGILEGQLLIMQLGNLCHLVCWPSCLHCYSFVVRLETSTRVSPSSYFLGCVGSLVFLCEFKHQFVCFNEKVELWIRIVR